MSVVINFNDIVHKAVNYNRCYIQGLVKYNKPIIVTGVYTSQCSTAYTKITFRNIKPYVTDDFDAFELTNHINILKSDFTEYFYVENDATILNKTFVLVCRPYFYYDDDGNIRASLNLTDELSTYGFPAVALLSQSKPASEMPVAKIIDFRKEFNYKFACPKDSKYNRYEGLIPVKDYRYIKSLTPGQEPKSLDRMIKETIGTSIITFTSNKKNNYYTKKNFKTSAKSAAKKRMYDLKHSFHDSIQSNYEYEMFN